MLLEQLETLLRSLNLLEPSPSNLLLNTCSVMLRLVSAFCSKTFFCAAVIDGIFHIAFDSTDRSGGFIGTMYASGGVNVAVELAREG